MLRTSAAALVVALGAAGLTACSPADSASGPDPDEAAGEFADVAFVDTTPDDVAEQYAKVVDGMGEDVAPTVTADDVDEKDGTATATLSWAWPVAGQQWTYTSEAELTEADDEWQLRWTRALVEPSLGERSVLDVTTVA